MATATIQQKTCNGCKILKDSSDFYACSKSGNLRPRCKECMKDQSKRRLLVSGVIEARRARGKRYRQAHYNPERDAHKNMIQRCLNPSGRHFKNYGGRGITVCQRWLESFDNFLADMGSKPSPLHTLERKDNNRGYEPKNCVWATREEQQNNRRANCIIEHQGEKKSVAQWARQFAIPENVLGNRFRRGWSFERATQTPVKPYKRA